MSTLAKARSGRILVPFVLEESMTTKTSEPIQRTVEREAAIALGGKLLFSYRLVARAAAIATLRELAKAQGATPAINKHLSELLGDEVLCAQALCAHEDLTGGNDYQMCNTCYFTWDYRKSTAAQTLFELIYGLLRLQVRSDVTLIELSQDDLARLTILLENAEAEVDAAADPEATVLPDDPSKLMSSYNWSKGLRARLNEIHTAD